MKISSGVLLGRIIPLVGLVFSVAVQAATVEEQAAAAAKYEAARVAYERYCAGMIAARKNYDVNEGIEEVELLHRKNREMERRLAEGTLTKQALIDEGIVKLTGEPLTDRKGQPFPFEKVLFPVAHTGAYFPRGKGGKPVHLPNFQAMAMLMGGIGFEMSIAASMREIGGGFVNGSGLMMSDGKPLRTLSVLIDAPLNGLGENAPFSFGHPRNIVEVMHHVHLVMIVFFGPLPTIGLGRSQGGINMLEYAHFYPNYLTAAILANSSSNCPDITRKVIENHESMARPENIDDAQRDGFSCEFHYKSWLAHEIYTPLYVAENHPSQVPVLHLVGRKDRSYPIAQYQARWEAWAARQPELRRVAYYDGFHNPWTRGAQEKFLAVYQEALALKREFLGKVLGR